MFILGHIIQLNILGVSTCNSASYNCTINISCRSPQQINLFIDRFLIGLINAVVYHIVKGHVPQGTQLTKMNVCHY